MSRNQKSAEDVIQNAKNIAFYGRVSTKEQNIEGHQQFVVEEYLKQFGKELSGATLLDTGSAYSKSYKDRAQFMDLLESVQKGTYDAVVVSDRDRISRQTDEHINLRTMFDQLGIPVIIASRNELYNTESFIQNIIEDALTKLESDNISVRTKEALKTMLKEELYIGGRPPYGYTLIKNEDTLQAKKSKVVAFQGNPIGLALVRIIFDAYMNGETFSNIAKQLNKTSSTDKWSATKVKNIVLNPIYTGYLFYNRYMYETGKRIFQPEDKWISYPVPFSIATVITLEEWWFCWQKYKLQKDKPPRYYNTSFYFNDLIRCHCKPDIMLYGKDQQTKNGMHGYRYYICPNCRTKIWAEDLHKKFFDLIFHMNNPKELVFQEIFDKLQKEKKHREMVVAKLYLDKETEEKNLSLLSEFRHKPDAEEMIAHDKKNSEVIAYHISKLDSEEKVAEIKKHLIKQEYVLEKLTNLMENPTLIPGIVTRFFDENPERELSNPEKRNLALFLVDHCSLIGKNQLHLRIKGLPSEDMYVKNFWRDPDR